MKRRPKGHGTIEQIVVEGQVRYRARFPFEPGKREDVGIYATREEAAKTLDSMLLQLNASGDLRGMTLEQWAPKVHDARERDGYRDVANERRVWKAYFAPWPLATMPMRTLTPGDVRARLVELRKGPKGKPRSTSTLKNARNVLNAVLKAAVEAEKIAANPAESVRVKDHGSTTEASTYLARAELYRLIRASTEAKLVAVAAGTGARQGELRALRWVDVHIEAANPYVVIRYGSPGAPPKNGKIRHIPIFGIALSALERLPRAGALVFPGPRGGPRAKGHIVEAAEWRAWLKAAGIKRRVKWHDLRHTAATLLLNGAWGRRWTYEEVKEMLGHSSVTVTERYARALGTLAEKAAAEMTTAGARQQVAREAVQAPAGAPFEGAISPEQAQRLDAAYERFAREFSGSRLRDLNSRPTVYESVAIPISYVTMARLLGLARAYVEAVSRGDRFSHQRGLDLAHLVMAFRALEAPFATGAA